MAWKDGTRFTPAGKPHDRGEVSFRDEQCLQCGFIGDGDYCTACQRQDESPFLGGLD